MRKTTKGPNSSISSPTPVSLPSGTAETAIASDEPCDETNSEPWYSFLATASDKDIRQRFRAELGQLCVASSSALEGYCCVALMDNDGSIGSFEADKIFSALRRLNVNKTKNVLLLLLSGGGSIEPAYQISKLCKSSAKERFLVSVPRRAKSAATLLALGADEIHMGPLGELGPIDPQLRGMPALGVVQALKTIASLSESHPGSAEMFARYLRMALTVEQIGYCERIAESAVQYAERLLSTKAHLTGRAAAVAKELVYEYKHHGFVIDCDEARNHFGEQWILSDTPVQAFAEGVYSLFEQVNLFLGFIKKQRLVIIGDLQTDVMIFNSPEDTAT